jgi:hypothetical protein
MKDKGFLCINSWAGRTETPCVILRETPKRFVIRLEADCALPGRNRRGIKAEEIRVARYSIRREVGIQPFSAERAQSGHQGVEHER